VNKRSKKTFWDVTSDGQYVTVNSKNIFKQLTIIKHGKRKSFTIRCGQIIKWFSRFSSQCVEIKSASLSTLYNYLWTTNWKTKGGRPFEKKEKHIVDDLEIAFDKFDVFLAHLDDAYTGNDNATELSILESEPKLISIMWIHFQFQE
jgi:hypothetical protein